MSDEIDVQRTLESGPPEQWPVPPSGCARPLSAERDGAVNAKDNPSATGDGGGNADLTDRQPDLRALGAFTEWVEALDVDSIDDDNALGWLNVVQDRARVALGRGETRVGCEKCDGDGYTETWNDDQTDVVTTLCDCGSGDLDA